MVQNTHKLTVTSFNLSMKMVKTNKKINLNKTKNNKKIIKLRINKAIHKMITCILKLILSFRNTQKELKIVFLKMLIQYKPLIKYGDFTGTFSNMITHFNG